MTLGSVTKFDKRNTTTSKKFGYGVMSRNCDVIVIFPIYDELGAIQMPVPDAWPVKLTFSLM